MCDSNHPPRWSTMIPNSWYLFVVVSPPILKQAYSLWLVEYGRNDSELFQMKLIKYTVTSTWLSLYVSCSGRSHLQWHGHTQDAREAHMARNLRPPAKHHVCAPPWKPQSKIWMTAILVNILTAASDLSQNHPAKTLSIPDLKKLQGNVWGQLDMQH